MRLFTRTPKPQHTHKTDKRGRKKLLLIPFTGGAAIVAGFAFAAWTSDGSGTGQVTARAAVDSVITPEDTSAQLYPGASGTISVRIDNPNPYPVIVTSISSGSSALVNTACAAGSVTSDARPTDATGLTQADGSTKVISAGSDGEYELSVDMIPGADNACQSQTFTLDLSATLLSAAS